MIVWYISVSPGIYSILFSLLSRKEACFFPIPFIFNREQRVILLYLEKSGYLAKIAISFLFFSLANFNISGHTSSNFFLNRLVSLTFSSIRVCWWRERSFRLSVTGEGFSILINTFSLGLLM